MYTSFSQHNLENQTFSQPLISFNDRASKAEATSYLALLLIFVASNRLRPPRNSLYCIFCVAFDFILLHCIVFTLYCFIASYLSCFVAFLSCVSRSMLYCQPIYYSIWTTFTFWNVLTLFDYVFVSAEEDFDESKVLCEIKTKSSDLSLLLGWKWCETDNNIKFLSMFEYMWYLESRWIVCFPNGSCKLFEYLKIRFIILYHG